MKTRTFVAIAALSACVAGGPVLAQTAPAQTAKTDRGQALVDAKGMALYTFAKDTAGKSNCNGQCASNWPPLAARPGDQAASPWTVIKRDDGSLQWAYQGKPLYTWVKDEKAGVAKGDGVGGVWHLAQP